MQQINLYLPEFHPKRIIMSAQHIGLGGLICIFILGFFSFSIWNKKTDVEQQLNELKNQQTVKTASIEKLKLAGQPAGQSIDQRIAAVRAAIGRRQQIKAVIDAQNLGNALGFSEAMKALAQQSTQRIALEQIRLSDNGRRLELSGNANDPKAIPTYLSALEKHNAFSQTNFGMVSVVSNTENKRSHRFSVGFNPIYEPAKEHDSLSLGVTP